MDNFCTSGETPRSQRRLNGLQLPLNYQQICSWIAFLITAILNFALVVKVQTLEQKVILLILYIVLYAFHIISHVTALFLDPAEEDLRKRAVNDIPEFDRSIHAHVIENGRCHLCNINTSNKGTKHCGICNKCVYHFDHHCKWLNSCVGRRNYVVFIICVTTSLLIAVLTATLCVTDFTLFFTYPQLLSTEAQNFVNCSSSQNLPHTIRYCTTSFVFLTLLFLLFASAVAISFALLHLLLFHIYISVLGVSTYEYIMTTGNTEPYRLRCCNISICKRFYLIRKTDEISRNPKVSNNNNNNNVGNLIQILINEEINRAKKTLLYDTNKVHPDRESLDLAS